MSRTAKAAKDARSSFISKVTNLVYSTKLIGGTLLDFAIDARDARSSELLEFTDYGFVTSGWSWDFG